MKNVTPLGRRDTSLGPGPARGRFPRPHRRGLIEAPPRAPAGPCIPCFPRPHRRGLIEAAHAPCNRAIGARVFHGLIAVASLKLPTSARPDGTRSVFHGLIAVASLKPQPGEPRPHGGHVFHGLIAVASLK